MAARNAFQRCTQLARRMHYRPTSLIRPMSTYMNTSQQVLKLSQPTCLSRTFCSKVKGEGMVINIQDEQDFEDRVINSEKPVVADFHAQWVYKTLCLGVIYIKCILKYKYFLMHTCAVTTIWKKYSLSYKNSINKISKHFSWCGPCKLLGPRLESIIGSKKGKVVLAKIDVDNNMEVAMRYNVGSDLAFDQVFNTFNNEYKLSIFYLIIHGSIIVSFNCFKFIF